MPNLVSIITPTYNSSEHIRATYNSIKEQSHTNWEWLVTDDCSDDDTVSILESISLTDNRVRIFKNTINSGAAVTRNNSLSEVSGRYIAFIDSDDLWVSSKLVTQINFMEKFDCDFSFTSFTIIDEQGNSQSKIVDKHNVVKMYNYKDMLKKEATLGCSTVMLKPSGFSDISMPLLRTGQDYALWLKLLKTGGMAYLCPQSLTFYRILPNSISRNKVKKAMRQWQIYRQVEKLSLANSMMFFIFYAFRAVFRR